MKNREKYIVGTVEGSLQFLRARAELAFPDIDLLEIHALELRTAVALIAALRERFSLGDVAAETQNLIEKMQEDGDD